VAKAATGIRLENWPPEVTTSVMARRLNNWKGQSGVMRRAGGISHPGSEMTEYVIKEIGHADRLSIGACADETEALQLIMEDSAKARTRSSADHKSGNIIKQTPVGCWQAARAMGLSSS